MSDPTIPDEVPADGDTTQITTVDGSVPAPLILDWRRAPLGWKLRPNGGNEEIHVHEVEVLDGHGDVVARFVTEGTEIAGRGFVEVLAARLAFDPARKRMKVILGGDAYYRPDARADQ